MTWGDSYIAIDTETTGFGPTARVIEVAVVVFEHGKPVYTWERLLNPPGVDWASEKVAGALAVNKIDPKDLVGKPAFEQVVPDLLLELSHDVWVMHNAEFDMQMLSQEMVRAGTLLATPKLVVCTKNLASHLEPSAKSNKLFSVAARYKVVQASAHRAHADALVCGQVLHEMILGGRLPSDMPAMLELTKTAAIKWKSRRY